jgi:hypothetical protein
MALIKAGLEMEQHLAPRIVAPFSQMPACVRCEALLTLASPAPASAEVSSF